LGGGEVLPPPQPAKVSAMSAHRAISEKQRFIGSAPLIPDCQGGVRHIAYADTNTSRLEKFHDFGKVTGVLVPSEAASDAVCR
jgi:hypothetical protein